MNGVEGVPVEEPGEAFGNEGRGLIQSGGAVGGLPDFVLKPGAARHLHLGLQANEPVFLQGLHSPKVDGVSYAKVVREAPVTRIAWGMGDETMTLLEGARGGRNGEGCWVLRPLGVNEAFQVDVQPFQLVRVYEDNLVAARDLYHHVHRIVRRLFRRYKLLLIGV